jgi:hypothetical protein
VDIFCSIVEPPLFPQLWAGYFFKCWEIGAIGMKKIVVFMSLAVVLLITGCAEIATLTMQDSFAKPATITRHINSNSVERGVKAAVTAAGKTSWTPKTISIETGYVLAEYQPEVVGRGARDYSYKLEVRIPEKGRGDVQVVVTPPRGIIGGVSPEVMANKFLDAFAEVLKK